ncbi:MAG: hypothetical protein ABSH10_02805 [Phycisphaerae bacterium]|jgi:hypothetical protein
MSSQLTELGGSPKVRKPLWRRIVKWTFCVAAVMVVMNHVAWGVSNAVTAKEVEAEIAKLRAAGQPVTFADWKKTFLPVAEANDAAPFYKAALALYQKSAWNNKVEDLLDRLQSLTTQPATSPAPSDAEIKEVLVANAAVLEQIDLGSSRPQCAYDFDLSQEAIDVVLPKMTAWRALAKLTQIRTIWLARQGQVNEAVSSLVSSFRLLRIADRWPTLVVSLVKVGGEALYVNAIPAILEAGPLSDPQLAAIESTLAQADPTVGMERIWAIERVYVLENQYEYTSYSMVVQELQTYRQCMEAAHRGWPKAFDLTQHITSDHPITSTFMLFGRTAGRVRSAEVAVMVERYRLAKGQLPVSLQELRDFVGHELPADPFTGKDLIYKVRGKGFMVYSVGDDKTDDGGPVQSPRKDWGLAVRWGPGK